ncbi:MAG: hypothetical protein NTX32_00930, partial [Candidatus Firestonebacteria bacterium]|nr:hypothetical protein [Candidatus Firestonebacteria bacterium]
VAWPAVITGNYNGTAQTTEAVLNDKNVEIVTLLARGIVTPHQLDGGQSSQAVTYRVTNAGADKLKSVRLTIPAGFTYVSSGTVTVTGGKTWTAAYAGGVVTLTPAGAGDYLISAEYVQAVINVATQTAYQAPTVWPAVATGENNGTVSVTVITAGDMSVEIIPLSATAVATPHIVPGGRASVAVTYRVTNSNTDALKLVQITIPAGFTYASLGAVSASLSKSWTASRSGAVITLTPTAAGDYIANTQYVQVVINVATQASAMAPATWPAVVTGSYNGTAAASEVTAGDRQVEIQILFANGLLTPHQVYNSSSVALTCRVTNAGTDDIRLAKITIPTGFTFNSLGTVSASLSKSWTSGIGGTVITLTPAASGDYLSSGQYVQVIINVTTQAAAQAAVIWPIGVTGNLSGAGAATEAVTNDMRVQIVTLNANGLATPHAVNTSQNTAITHRTTNTGTDRLKKVVITVPAGFSSITPGVLTATGGKIWTASAGGSLITLNAATANDYITTAQYVEVVIGVLTQATALSAVAWPALVTGENNNTFSSTEAVAGNMKVAIVNLAANGLVTPHVVYNSRPSVGLTYRVTGSQAEKIKSASLTIPGGFTYVSLGTPAASGGKNWTASYAGGVVTLNASLAGDYLDNTEYVQVLINVATQAGTLAATIWPGRVTGASDTFRDIVEPVAGAMQVEIKTLAATAVVTPHVVSSSRTGVALTYIITGTGTDNIQLALITIPAGFTYESIVSVTASGIKSWSGVCAGSVITLQANSAGDNIATGEYVQLIVNTATQGANQAPVTWPVALTGAAGGTVPGTEAAAGDMQIQIATLAANGLITPHQVLGSLASVAITCRVSNINTYKIKEAKITIPAGFTYVSNGLVSASGAKVWTGSYSGGELTLSAALPVNYLDNAEYIEVIINVSTQSADLAPAEWPVLVTGESNNTVAATEAAAGNMKVEIFAISAAGLITPHLVAGQSLVPFTYRITNTSLGIGVIKRIRITIPSGFTYVSTGAITAGGKNWTAAYASNVITLNPQTSADYINKTEFVQVVISVTTASAVQAATAWPVSITGSNDIILAAAEAAAGDMQVAITMLSATGVITPHAVSSGMASQLMNYVVTNTNVGSITGLNIIIPAGFTYVNLGILTITGGKSWSAAYSNGVITLTAQTGSDSLNTGENISVPITVATQAAGLASVIWPVIITGFVSGTFSASEAVSGDMKVNIVAYTLTVASDSAVILPSSTITVRGTLLDINAAPKSGAVINFSILSGDAVLTGSTAATTDISGKAYVRVSFGASGGKVTVRGMYGVNNSTDAVFEVLTAAPLLSANNLNFDKANITYAKATTKFKLQGISGLTLEYKIDGGSWQVYAGEFSLTSVGAHTVYYRYSDANGVKGPFGSAGIYVTPTDSKFVNYPNPFAAGKDSTVLEYNLPEDAQVKVEIFNLFGELVWSKEASSGQPGGKAGINNAFIWDGKNNIGEVVANGGYICRITAAGASSTNVQRRKIGVIK